MPAIVSTNPPTTANTPRTGREQFLQDLHGDPSSAATDDNNEQVPVKRAVRMVVGLSESTISNTSSSNGGADSTPPYDYQHDMNMRKMVMMDQHLQKQQQQQVLVDDSTTSSTATTSTAVTLPRKNRQESDGTAETYPSMLSALEEQLRLDDEYDNNSHSQHSSHSSTHGDDKMTTVTTSTHPSSHMSSSKDHDEHDDDHDETWSDSGVYSVGKLYGRTEEQEKLHDLYNYIVEHGKYNQNQNQNQQYEHHPCREFVLISGSVGTGKTSLAETLRKKVMVDDDGYFCTGTFDQLMQRGPMAPMVDAFAQFVGQVVEKGDVEIDIIQRRIRCMVDPQDITALEGILPSLADLLAFQPKTTSTAAKMGKECNACRVAGGNGDTATRTDNRAYSHLAMIKLMRAISRPDHPVVLVLDDLQWAGGCAFEFLRPMTMDDMNDGLMYIGTTRDDVSPDSEVSRFLRFVEDGGVHITNINLGLLGLEHVQEMVNDNFLMPIEKLTSLANLMYMHSSGNPFFMTMSIQTMQREPRLIAYDKDTNTWSINNEAADQYCNHCPIHMIMKKLEMYPREQQKVLSVAACLGSHATQSLIETALQEDASESLQILVSKGKLVLDEKQKTYTIRHNAIKEAAKDLIGIELLPAYHLEIGLRLMMKLDPQELDDNLFCVVSQLREGLHLLQDQTTKYEVAAIFVRMAEKAAVTFSFDASHKALQMAYGMLGPNHWEEAYDLSLAVYNYLAEIEFAVHDNERVDQLIDEVFEKGKTCTDKLRAYTTRVHVLGVRGEADKAIEIGLCILDKLGAGVRTTKTTYWNTFWAFRNVEKRLKGRSNERLLRSPLMTDQKLLTCMQVLNLLFLNTFHHRIELFPFVVLKMMKLSLKHGFSAMTAVAFGGYGTLLCFMGREHDAQRYGKLALDLTDQYDAAAYRSRVYALHYGCIQPCIRPWKESLEFLKEGHRLGLSSGDIEFAMYNANLYFSYMLDDGSFTIDEITTFMEETLELTKLHGNPHQYEMMSVCYENLKQCSDPTGNAPCGTDFDVAIKAALKHGNLFSIGMLYCFKASNCMFTGDFKQGLEILDERRSVIKYTEKSIFESYEHYLDGVFAFGMARRETNACARKKLIQRGKKDMKILQRVGMMNPDACGSKALLLEAEYAALTKKDMVAYQKYSQSIAIGTGRGAIFEVSFANLIAADHFAIDRNDPKTAIVHLEEAAKSFERWGDLSAPRMIRERIDSLKQNRKFSLLR